VQKLYRVLGDRRSHKQEAMMKCNHILLTVWIIALLVAPGGTHAAEITVLSNGPLAPALKPIAERFHSASGHNVKFVFGLSPAIHKMVTEGQTADVVITQPNFINELGMRA